MEIRWRPFQRRIFQALKTKDCIVLSAPWASGKSTLAAHLLRRTLDPGDELHKPGQTSFLVAGSLGQATKGAFAILRSLCVGDEFRISESTQQASILHKSTGSKVSVLACVGKRNLGIVRCPLAVGDEPGSWPLREGELLHNLIQGSLLKPDGIRQAVYIGTLAPAGAKSWWREFANEPSNDRRHVELIQGDRETWFRWYTIAKASPILWGIAKSRAGLLAERDAARSDSTKRANFLNYRLNLPAQDENDVLLTVEDWKLMLARPPAPRRGRPVVGLDLGKSRAWSAAVAIWPQTMRVETVAICGGVPPLEDREKADHVRPGTYQRLADMGQLHLDANRRVPRIELLLDLIAEWRPSRVICDRFLLPDLLDLNPAYQVIPRRARWSESTYDIEATRELALDGGLNVAMSSRSLLEHSVGVSLLERDKGGSCRLVKSTNNFARDDVCHAWVRACGEVKRQPAESSWSAVVLAGDSDEVLVVM